MPQNRKMAHGKPCPYCGRTMDRFSERLSPTFDHVVPRALGGRVKIICCQQCNGIKADMLPEQWASYMAANPGWWKLGRAEQRAARRANREWARSAKWGPRRPQWQGSPPTGPVVVPPHLIWPENSAVAPLAVSQFILAHGKRAYRHLTDTGQMPDQPAVLPISASS